MPNYTVTFDRIGRNHNVPPLVVKNIGEEDLADRIFKYAKPHLRSNDVEVIIKDDTKGFIACGMRAGANFTIETK